MRHRLDGVCVGAQFERLGNRCKRLAHIIQNVLRSDTHIAVARQIGGEAENAAMGLEPCSGTGHRLTVLSKARRQAIEVLSDGALCCHRVSGQMQVSALG